jgi:CRISPR-associated protein Cas1
MPLSCVVPFEANALHAKTLREQVECSLPKKKQIWKQVARAKIEAQAAALVACRGEARAKVVAASLLSMAQDVRSGDPDNLEAQAAADYFAALFGDEFVRDRELPGTNAALNYGYAILRAMIARALVGAGLHPALGVHHRGPANSFNLADDAIEPLRPMVDEAVFRLDRALLDEPRLPKEARAELLKITVSAVKIAGKRLPIEQALERYAASWKEALCGEARRLAIPIRLP